MSLVCLVCTLNFINFVSVVKAKKSHEEKFGSIIDKLGKSDSGFVKYPAGEEKPSTTLNGSAQKQVVSGSNAAVSSKEYSKKLMEELNQR